MRRYQKISTASVFALMASVSTIAMIGSAGAADLPGSPVYKAAPSQSIYNWTGLYIGGNLGGSFGRSTAGFTDTGTTVASASTNTSGVIGGGQIGLNWQTGQLVLGAETDIQGSSQKGISILTGNAAGVAVNQNPDWFGTVRARLGFTPDPRWLVYTTGGLAYGDVKTRITASDASAIGSFTNTRTGWTIGGGVEAALWNNWTAKVEYLYIDLGSSTNALIGEATGIIEKTRTTDNIVRAGLNYRF